MAEKKDIKIIAKNKKARFDYEIEETFEAGVVLTGTEVKALREHNCQITDSFALIRKGEVWLNNVYIAPYSHGNRANPEPDRKRKLLMHRKQIRYLDSKVAEKGYTLVPLMLYFDESNRVKLQLGLGRGKKNYDKRAAMATRDSQRDIERALKVERER